MLTLAQDALDDDASSGDLPMMDRQDIRKLLVENASDVDALHGVDAVAGLSPPSSVSHAGRP